MVATQPAELLPAAIVLADASVMASAPDAVEGCADALALANEYGDIQRAAIAAGLHGVAVFQHHSCRQARHLIEQVGARFRDPDTAVALAQAAVTLDGCCARRGQTHWPPASRPVITAGGRTQPGIGELFFSDRLLRWPGCHDCVPTSAPQGSMGRAVVATMAPQPASIRWLTCIPLWR